VVLPDGEISDIDLDSDPDDPARLRSKTRAELLPWIRSYADLCPLEVVTAIRDEHPEGADTQTMNSPADSLPHTSHSDEARQKKPTKQKATRAWKKMDLSGQDTTWKGEIPHHPTMCTAHMNTFARSSMTR
ncbi:unnamed protein product, partial [Ixodes hexagonus]